MSEDLNSGAVLCYYNGKPDYSGAGGGMSASENRMANYRGKVIGDPSGPKSTSGGADLGPSAKNVKMVLGHPSTGDEVTPSAHRHSRNQKAHHGSGRSSNRHVDD